MSRTSTTILLALFAVVYLSIAVVWLVSESPFKSSSPQVYGDLTDDHGKPMLLEDYLRSKGKLK